MPITMEGINQMNATLNRAKGDYKRKAKNAMGSIVKDIANWIKKNHTTLGGWQDDTHNLKNSISSTVITSDNGATIIGVVYAGMDYAVDVEFKEGHWVISGGMKEWEPKFLQIMARRVKEQVGGSI